MVAEQVTVADGEEVVLSLGAAHLVEKRAGCVHGLPFKSRYDIGAKALPVETLPDPFAFSLLSEDWDQFEPLMKNAIHRTPCLETARVKMLLNGPESFTSDNNFLLGETAELRGLFVAAGFNSIDIGAMHQASWLGMDVLMFIGGGPAGTASGVKITTASVLLFIVLAVAVTFSDVSRIVSGESFR